MNSEFSRDVLSPDDIFGCEKRAEKAQELIDSGVEGPKALGMAYGVITAVDGCDFSDLTLEDQELLIKNTFTYVRADAAKQGYKVKTSKKGGLYRIKIAKGLRSLNCRSNGEYMTFFIAINKWKDECLRNNHTSWLESFEMFNT